MAGLIVHEWIARHGGSENVLESMARAFPGADILALWNDTPSRFDGRPVRESWMAQTPLRRNKAAALPFMPATWARMDVDSYDFVLVSSHLFAHHVGGKVRETGPQKFVYVHTPARYIWTPHLDERGSTPLARLASPALRRLDRARAADGSVFAANSAYVRDRIRSAWDQDAVVIHPPVDTGRLQATISWRDVLDGAERTLFDSLPADFVLGASRFVPYKRIDLAVAAGEALGRPVVLAGSGPLQAELRARAAVSSVPVVIVDRPSDRLLYALYEAASLFVFPPVEDFGIMPVEAMSLGTPVLVNSVGGARESVAAAQGGAALDSFDATSIREGAEIVQSLDRDGIRTRVASIFSEQVFADKLQNWMGTDAGR